VSDFKKKPEEQIKSGAAIAAETNARVFSETWQEAVFGHMLKNYHFFLKCRQYLLPNWFQNPRLYTLADELFKLYDDLRRLPTVSEFIALKVNSMIDTQEAQRFRAAIDRSLASSGQIAVDIISKEMTGWLKISRFMDEMKKSSNQFNEGNYHSAISWIKKTSADIEKASFESDKLADFSDPVAFYSELSDYDHDGISTGSAMLDALLIGKKTFEKDGKSYQMPGLGRKTMTVLVGAANSGKTSCIISILRHAVADQKKVLFLTHEQSEAPIKDKIYKACFNMSADQMSIALRDETLSKKLRVKAQIINKYLKYRHYNEIGKMYVEDVLDLIQALNEKEIALTGRGFDLVIDDYPAKLMSRNFGGKGTERRHLLGYVYSQFSMLADSMNCHVIAPVQTNRASYKQMKDGGNFLDMDSISESFEVAQIADNVITINRSDDNKRRNEVYLNIAKNRRGETGNWYYSKTDLSRSLMYGPGQGLAEATGTGEMKFEELLSFAHTPPELTSKKEEPNVQIPQTSPQNPVNEESRT